MKEPKCRLTEKKMSDARFRRIENLILDITYREGPNFSVKQMAKKAGFSKSTFYSHHAAAYTVVPDTKKFILRSYARRIQGQAQIKRLYITTLFFILNHKHFFIFLTKHGDRELIINMLRRLNHKIELATKMPKNSDKILRVHSGEVCELINHWCEMGMPKDAIDRLIVEVMLLTDTARSRLIELLG